MNTVTCERGHEHPSFIHDGVTYVERVGTCHVIATRGMSDEEWYERFGPEQVGTFIPVLPPWREYADDWRIVRRGAA